MLLKSSKEDNQKQKESSLGVKEDINKDKEELVNSIAKCYTCIKALLG